MPQLKRVDEFGAIDDEDFGAIDDTGAGEFGAVEDTASVAIDPAVNPLEVQSRVEEQQKAQAAAIVALKIQQQRQAAEDPDNWTLQETKDRFKQSPPKTIEEEAVQKAVLKKKTDQVKAVQDKIYPQAELTAAPPKNIFGKIRGQIEKTLGDVNMIESPEGRRAKSEVAYAIAKQHGLDPVEVEKHYEDYFFNPKYTGMKAGITPLDMVNAAMTPAVVAGIAMSPEVVLPALAVFGVLDKIVPTHELLKNTNLTRGARQGVELIDMALKGMAGGAAGAKTGAVLRAKFPAFKKYSDFWHGVMGKEPPVDPATPEQPAQAAKAMEVPKPKADPVVVKKFQAKVFSELEKTNAEGVAKGEALTGPEKAAQAWVVKNPEQARENYINRSVEEFKSDNVLSADIGKFAVDDPATGLKMTAARSRDFHEAGSAMTKAREAELLADKSTRELPTVFTAGGSGSGKSNLLRGKSEDTGHTLKDDYGIVYDTNMDGYDSAVLKIKKNLADGRHVDIMYVYRDPLVSWSAVLERVLTQDRIVPIVTHIKTHQFSLPTVKRIASEFAQDGRLRVSAIDNSFGKGEFKELKNLDEVPKFDYTGIEDKLYDTTRAAYQSGKITREHFQAAVEGSPKLEKRFLEEPSDVGPRGQEGVRAPESGGTPAAGLEPPKTEPPVTPLPSEPAPPAEKPVVKERSFIETVRTAEKTTPEVSQEVKGLYEVIPNKLTLERAREFVEKTPERAMDRIERGEINNAMDTATAAVLIDKAQFEGRIGEAVRLAEKTAARLTEMGQAIQAAYIYERLSPEGILLYAQRVVQQAKENIPQKARVKSFDKMAEALKDPDKAALAKKLGIPHISEAAAAELLKMAKEIKEMPDGRAKHVQTAVMLKKITDLIPKSLGQKISMLQTMAQLLNPKTFVRNVLGNLGFQAAEGLSDSVAVALDIAAALKTGKRTVYMPDVKTQAAGLKQGFKEGVEESLLGINLKEDTTKFTLPKNGVFDKGVLGALEKTLRISLGATDRAFYQAAFNQSIRDQMVSAKERGIDIKEPDAEMVERAHLLGLYRTFQDENVISRQFIALKKWFNLGKDWGIGDMVLKYPKTPANLIARGIEYSPFGFIKTVYELTKPLLGHEFNQEAFVRSTSRALTGSATLVGTGAILAQLGIISGKRSKDRDVSAARENVGIRDYQLNAAALKRFAMSGFDPEAAALREDDQLVTYDWFLPGSIGLALGANMVLDPKTNLVDRALNMGDRMLQASETLQEQPLVRGVKTLTQRQNIAEGLSDTFQDIPASFVPTLLNQIRQLTDNTARNTKDPNYFKEVYNKAIMRVPGASGTLPPKVTTLGEDKQMYQMGTNNPFNVFLNPAFVSKYKPDPVSKMVLEIWEMSGQTIQFPRVAQGKIKLGADTPEPVELTAEQYTEFQRYIGNKTDVLFTILADNESFMALDDEIKAKKLQGFLTDINTAAKIEILGYRPKKVPADVIGIIQAIGQDKRAIDTAGDSDEFGAKDDEEFGAMEEAVAP